MNTDDATKVNSTSLSVWRDEDGDAPHYVVVHDMPFVAQLIAHACEPGAPFRRRKSDRVAPLRAYAATVATTPRPKATRTV